MFKNRARLNNTAGAWERFRKERNKVVSMLRDAKRLYYNEAFDNAKSNSRVIWKTIKSLTGNTKNNQNKQTINKLKDDDRVLEDNVDIARKFNNHFSTIADRLRSTMPDVAHNIDKLLNFVQSRKDPNVSFEIPPISTTRVVCSL